MPGVAYREMHFAISGAQLEAHFADVGELDGVARKVHENLANLVDVARHADRRRRERRTRSQTLLVRQRFDDRGDSVNQVGGEEIGWTNPLATFVETGERQNLFDDGREMLRHRAHALEDVELTLGHRPDDLIGEQLPVAGERGQRRAELV